MEELPTILPQRHGEVGIGKVDASSLTSSGTRNDVTVPPHHSVAGMIEWLYLISASTLSRAQSS
jgi:hypothetical protein